MTLRCQYESYTHCKGSDRRRGGYPSYGWSTVLLVDWWGLLLRFRGWIRKIHSFSGLVDVFDEAKRSRRCPFL